MYSIRAKLFFHMIFFVIFCSGAFSETSQPIDQDEYLRILNQFKPETIDQEILEKFDSYLKDVSSYDNEHYIAALNSIAKEYYRAIVDLGDCVNKVKELESNYSQVWVASFEKQFEKKIISDHRDELKLYIFEIGMKQANAVCRDKVGECFFIEAFCMKALNEYIQYFLDFAKTVEGVDKDKLNKWVATAELCKENLHHFIQEIKTAGNITMALCALGIQPQNDIPPEMKTFFSTDPQFSKPFNYMKAIKDLDRIVEN